MEEEEEEEKMVEEDQKFAGGVERNRYACDFSHLI